MVWNISSFVRASKYLIIWPLALFNKQIDGPAITIIIFPAAWWYGQIGMLILSHSCMCKYTSAMYQYV